MNNLPGTTHVRLSRCMSSTDEKSEQWSLWSVISSISLVPARSILWFQAYTVCAMTLWQTYIQALCRTQGVRQKNRFCFVASTNILLYTLWSGLAAKISRNRTLCTRFLRLIFDGGWRLERPWRGGSQNFIQMWTGWVLSSAKRAVDCQLHRIVVYKKDRMEVYCHHIWRIWWTLVVTSE